VLNQKEAKKENIRLNKVSFSLSHTNLFARSFKTFNYIFLLADIAGTPEEARGCKFFL
jgi:hypothetical protein